MSYLQTILMWFSLVAACVLSVIGFAIWCVRHAPYGLQGDAQQRGRDILVACNEAAATFSSRDRNVASPLYEIPQPEMDRVPANVELAQNWWRGDDNGVWTADGGWQWISDQSLVRIDEAYRNSKRRLAILRYALPYQTNEQARELLMSAIDTLVAYPEANLQE